MANPIVSTPVPQNFVPTNPQLKDLLDRFGQSLLINLNCHHLGTIQSFDETQQTATVSVNYQKTFYVLNPLTQQYEPQFVSYPTLSEAPVICLGGGSTALTFPIQKGDECLLLFNDRDLDQWFAGSSTSPVATPRLHSFSDAICLVGVRSLPNILTQYDTVRALIRAGMTPNSMTALGVNPQVSKVLITNTYPSNSTTLNTLLQSLMTDLQNLISTLTTNAATFIAVTGSAGSPSPLNPVIVSSLTSLASSLSTLATQIGGLLE